MANHTWNLDIDETAEVQLLSPKVRHDEAVWSSGDMESIKTTKDIKFHQIR